MIPGTWEFVLLVLAAYRITRLGGWDEFPLAARIRAFIIGEHWEPAQPIGQIESMEETAEGLYAHGVLFEEDLARAMAEPVPDPERPTFRTELHLPGKQPASLVDAVRPAYDRPTLAHLIHCPFCLGWWVSLSVWGIWSLTGHWALVAFAPFAISGAVGLLAKNLDA